MFQTVNQCIEILRIEIGITIALGFYYFCLNSKKQFVMRLINLRIFLFVFILLVSTHQKVEAQETQGDVQTEQLDYLPEDTESTTNAELSESENTPKKKKSFWSKLAFWKKDKQQAEEVDPSVEFNVMSESIWHENIARYMGVNDEEFYRFGYVKKGMQWYPIFFLRRFKMMQNEYEHTLIIHGKPAKLPKVKGLNIGPYGLEVTNEGFEFQMPTTASVSRTQKKYDDTRAIEVATMRMQSFGFDQVVWLKDKKRETKDLSDTWSFSTDQK